VKNASYLTSGLKESADSLPFEYPSFDLQPIIHIGTEAFARLVLPKKSVDAHGTQGGSFGPRTFFSRETLTKSREGAESRDWPISLPLLAEVELPHFAGANTNFPWTLEI